MVKKVKKSNKKRDKSQRKLEIQNESGSNINEHLEQIDKHIYMQELKFFEDCFIRVIEKNTPEDCVPINADVRTFDFQKLIDCQLEVKKKLFDVIMMDPPWQLSGATPTRGVTISYEALSDQAIKHLPLAKLQKSGLLFLWTINAKYRTSLQLLDDWGYKFVDEIAWVKKTCNNKIAKSHGY